jgi:hypothetical protein
MTARRGSVAQRKPSSPVARGLQKTRDTRGGGDDRRKEPACLVLHRLKLHPTRAQSDRAHTYGGALPLAFFDRLCIDIHDIAPCRGLNHESVQAHVSQSMRALSGMAWRSCLCSRPRPRSSLRGRQSLKGELTYAQPLDTWLRIVQCERDHKQASDEGPLVHACFAVVLLDRHDHEGDAELVPPCSEPPSAAEPLPYPAPANHQRAAARLAFAKLSMQGRPGAVARLQGPEGTRARVSAESLPGVGLGWAVGLRFRHNDAG